jgi:hypothetical protein
MEKSIKMEAMQRTFFEKRYRGMIGIGEYQRWIYLFPLGK